MVVLSFAAGAVFPAFLFFEDAVTRAELVASNLHLWTAKAAAVVFCACVVATFTIGFTRWLYLLAVAAWILCNVEGTLVLLTRDRVDERVGSILRPAPQPRRPA